ncbi:AMP-dependent synthetase/ligase [Gordonia sp. (in: high G+C Gram-positive bacteria)]|uniref:AMP-dependent synthetase/ligase n=1 Tax=Gordonia sp. (in: high G+C Gram-positive bacteria) TaxID=84139 RepID=UPI003F9CD8A5
MSHPKTLTEAFQRTALDNLDAIALRTPGDGVTITWRQYRDRVQSIATGLASLSVGSGDTVALMLSNRPEFHLVDTATLHAGATPFSMYNTNPPEMLAYLFSNADNRVVVCEKQFLPAIREAMQLGGTVEHVVCVDGGDSTSIDLEDLEHRTCDGFDFDAAWKSVHPDDVLTIVYTSGTTGNPKGVELTHENFIENAKIVEEFGGVSSADRGISYLPDAHAANRWFTHYQSLLHGAQITTVSDAKHVLEALKEIRPTAFLGVPRLWIKAKAGLEAQLATESVVKRTLINEAIAIGRAKAHATSAGRPLSFAARVRYAVADRVVLSSIRRRIGMDKLRMAVTGAAPIPPEVHDFILALGIPLCEGYGMTECTAAASVHRQDHIKVGTVGKPAFGVEVRIAADGEVLVRGKNVMRGYRKEPEKTMEAIDVDGWLHTGDIGVFDDDGFLKIVDRKKEIIINAAGKNMSPTNIENALAANIPIAGPVAVIGEQRVYNTALITLDPDALANLGARSVADWVADPAIIEQIENGVAAANQTLSRVEQIKKFTILTEVWGPGSDCLTPTNKLRRKPIAARYAKQIEAMY